MAERCYCHTLVFQNLYTCIPLTVEVLAQLCECTKSHGLIHCKWVNYVESELYLNKDVKNPMYFLIAKTYSIP